MTNNVNPEDMETSDEVAGRVASNLRIFGVLAFVILFLAVIANFLVAKSLLGTFPKRQYVYTQNANAVCSFTPITEAGINTDATITNYAANVVASLHTFDFANWRDDLDRVLEKEFTPEGREDYTKALRESEVLKTVLEERLTTTSKHRESATILSKGLNVEAVRFEWVIQVPIVVAYATANDYRPENRDLTVTVVRTPVTATNPYGVKVSKVFSTQSTTNQ